MSAATRTDVKEFMDSVLQGREPVKAAGSGSGKGSLMRCVSLREIVFSLLNDRFPDKDLERRFFLNLEGF
jgi:hypothetical protein